MAKNKNTAADPTGKPVPPAPDRRRTPRKPKSEATSGPVDITSISAPAAAASAADFSSGNMPSTREPTHEEISVAAYHRYLRRGGIGGDQFSDWVEAERELRSLRTHR
jgi:hypothetical protein